LVRSANCWNLNEWPNLVSVNTAIFGSANGSPHQRNKPCFSTVLVYEDLPCGKRAWNFYEKLTHRFEEDFEFSHLMWSFSVLGSSQTLNLASRSAVDAHLVILSFIGNARLPASVKDWVKHWARIASSQSSALVTLVDPGARSVAAADTHSYLRRILETRKIDFFPHGLSHSALRTSRPE
jgi:hypothetical protein